MATTTTRTTTTSNDSQKQDSQPINFCQVVSKLASDPVFIDKLKAKAAPLPMMAFAEEVADKTIVKKKTNEHFDGLAMEVPSCDEGYNNPQCHSIVGQKLLHVDWTRMCGLQVPCPDGSCQGTLENDRSNCSKNKTLFPIFHLDAPPTWCVTMKMECSCCHRPFDSNDGDVLVNLPDYAADQHPVDTQCAFTNYASHLSRATTDVFSSIMLTYGNGELCSKLLCNTMNRAYVRRLKACYSVAKKNAVSVPDYVPKDGVYIKTYPPHGDTMRDMFQDAACSKKNPWRVSDFERHTRKMQSVKCSGIFAQDHTFEPVKNYMKRVGAKAAWTVGTGTGEIAAVALVPTTKTKDFAHAARQVMKRPHFNPKGMCSDAWPNKNSFWGTLCPGMEGRLGLFHYEKRIIHTMRKKHVDCSDAINDLLSALCTCHPPDYEKLLTALKEGTMSQNGHKHSSADIANLQASGLFRDRYSKHLRKQLHSTETIIQKLDDWFCKHKVTSSDDTRPARGRLDPIRNVPLFTAETKDAVENCKEKARYLADPLPLNQMYDEIPPSPNSKHQLTEFLSKRGESKLESFHDRFAHFANCGMRESLADSLNLAGAALFNLTIRHKRTHVTTENTASANTAAASANPTKSIVDRNVIPAGWEKVLPYFNHTELGYVNKLAQSVGCSMPFPNAEPLLPDNGERFFSQHMKTLKSIGNKRGDNDECLCELCAEAGSSNAPNVVPQPQPPPQQQPTTTTTTATRKKKTKNKRNQTAATQPHQLAKTVTHTVRAPAVVQQHFHSIAPMPCFYHPMNVFYMPPALVPPPACCLKYQAWLTTRKGRPPHHPLCPNR